MIVWSPPPLSLSLSLPLSHALFNLGHEFQLVILIDYIPICSTQEEKNIYWIIYLEFGLPFIGRIHFPLVEVVKFCRVFELLFVGMLYLEEPQVLKVLINFQTRLSNLKKLEDQ